MSHVNQYGQIIGDELHNWTIRAEPGPVILTGRTCQLEPLDPDKHTGDLYKAFTQSIIHTDWTYFPIDVFDDEKQCYEYFESKAKMAQSQFYTVIDLVSNKAVGSMALLRYDAANGNIEVGVNFSPLLKRTVSSTEAHYLLMAYAFDDLSYRRYEWKSVALNTQSCKAAERLGFKFEGISRQGTICKNRVYDLASYSILDKEWPQLKAAFEAWLTPDNFDEHGNQVKKLSEFQKH